MRRRVALLAMTILLTLVLSPLAAGGQQPPGPTTRHQFRVEGLPPAGPFEVAQAVLDFAPGAATPMHTHSGQTLVTVLEGTVTRREGSTDTAYRAGESWLELPGTEHLALNATAAKASVIVTFVLPKGAPLSTAVGGGAQPAPPAPTTRHQFRTEGVPVPGPFEVAHIILDFAPGAWTPPHTHPGQTVVTVLEGTVTRRGGGADAVYRAGENWVEPGVVHQAGNDTGAKASVMGSFLLPKGAPLTTVAATAPGLPNTGMGGERRLTPSLWLLVLAGTGLGAGGWVGWRRLLGAR